MRLTEQMRQDIADRICETKFRPLFNAITERKKQLGTKLYGLLYSPEVLMAMAVLPNGYLPETCGLRVSFGGSYQQVDFPSMRRVAFKHDHGTAASFDTTHELTQLAWDLEKDFKRTREDRSNAYRQALAVMNSVTTLKRLREIWPEIIPYLSGYVESAPMTRELTVSLVNLNLQLGLPPKEAK